MTCVERFPSYPTFNGRVLTGYAAPDWLNHYAFHQTELRGSLAFRPSRLLGSLRTELHGPFETELQGSFETELRGSFETEL